jgi:GMP synthase (glutamine-hydrolysing)
MILIIDFGSQTTHLISRRIRDFGIEVKIITPEEADDKLMGNEINSSTIHGIILSGGPDFVNNPGAPTINKQFFLLGIPILGICYGHQLTGHLLGGKVKPGKTKEFGPAMIEINQPSKLFTRIRDNHFSVWMSHGDEVVTPPTGFTFVAQTSSVKGAVMQNEKQKIYGLQFHPEVKHTRNGSIILRNFVSHICGLTVTRVRVNPQSFIQSARETLIDAKVIAAVSGGVDSTVAAAIVGQAIGDRLIPIYIENGLMRPGTQERVRELFEKQIGIPVLIVDAKKLFLDSLRGIIDPEQKRKIIGNLYIQCFDQEAKKITGAKYLVQGTIYSDVIESKGSKYADKIKSHHNVGGLPENMNLKLYEPLRELYKDEVRVLGSKLGLNEDIIDQQPFPGPGQAIRIIGEVTEERLKKQQQADQIVLEEIKLSGWLGKVFQSFPVMTNTKSTAVKGDGRFYGEVVALRVYGSDDIMTASWVRLPYDLLQKLSSRIVNEVPGISRVVYDITTKPPATMEWE